MLRIETAPPPPPSVAPATPPIAARRLARAGVLGAGLALALGGNALAYAQAGYRPWSHALGAACANVVHMLVVGAAAWWTARRTSPPPAGPRWHIVVLRHAGVALTTACAVVALGVAVMRASHRHGGPATAAAVSHPPFDAWASVSWFVFWYAAVAAGVTALAAQARARAQERAAAHAQVVALRAQLNPHFLFNTLHSVAGLAREDAGAVEDVLERLGSLLRYVLRAATVGPAGGVAGPPTALELVTVAEELAFVRDYLAIEQLRLGTRLRVVEAVAGEVLDRRLPPLALQPLVENAVRHAAAPRRSGATVTMRGWRDGTGLVLEVADDGPGADPARAARLGGVGLAAVRQQLAAHYGPRAALIIRTAPGAGFCARLALPGDWADPRGPARRTRAIGSPAARAGART